jgi:hypothetical protein
MSTAPSR